MTGSSQSSLPSSARIEIAAQVKALVLDAIFLRQRRRGDDEPDEEGRSSKPVTHRLHLRSGGSLPLERTATGGVQPLSPE